MLKNLSKFFWILSEALSHVQILFFFGGRGGYCFHQILKTCLLRKQSGQLDTVTFYRLFIANLSPLPWWFLRVLFRKTKRKLSWCDFILFYFIAQCSCISGLCPGDPSQHFPVLPHTHLAPSSSILIIKILTLKKCWPRKIVKSWSLSFIPPSVKLLKNN